jgi:hypothetical protein
MNFKPQPNSSMSTTELNELMQSPDPGTATQARSGLNEKVNKLWSALDAKELADAKRSRRKIIATLADILGFMFAAASAFFWFWSAVVTDPSKVAAFNSAAALCAVAATLMLIYLRGKSNMNSKAENEVYQAIKAAKLYQNQKQLDLQEELNELKIRLNTLEATKNQYVAPGANDGISSK